jgi:hypothetical protein
MEARKLADTARLWDEDLGLVVGLRALSGGRRLRMSVQKCTSPGELFPVDMNIWLTDSWPAMASNTCDLVDTILTTHLMHRFGIQGVIASNQPNQ